MSRTATVILSVSVLTAAVAFAVVGEKDATNGHEQGNPRVVSAGASVTEILYTLGVGDWVVATDQSSQFPEQARVKPKIGYHRNLTAEGIIAQRPDMVIVTEEAGPPTTLAQLRAAKVNVASVSSEPTAHGAYKKIQEVGEHVGRLTEAKQKVASMKSELAILDAELGAMTSHPRVMFIYARGSGALLVGGRETAAAGIIELAHGTNAVDGYSKYKPLTAEAVISAAPDVILIPQRALKVVGGLDGVLNAPGVNLTPAGKNQRIVAVDDVLLLGFGPRLPDAVRWLSKKIHPSLANSN